MTTNWFDRRSLRSSLRTRPAFSRESIWAVSADRKTSAGPPAMICFASALDAPKENVAVLPLCALYSFAMSCSASVVLAAAKTRIS
jgi:hypothetical protein